MLLRNLGVVEKRRETFRNAGLAVLLEVKLKLVAEMVAPSLSEEDARRPARIGRPAFSGAVTRDLIFWLEPDELGSDCEVIKVV